MAWAALPHSIGGKSGTRLESGEIQNKFSSLSMLLHYSMLYALCDFLRPAPCFFPLRSRDLRPHDLPLCSIGQRA